MPTHAEYRSATVAGGTRGAPRIVVVGGGIAGIVVATHLARRLARRRLAAITLIDKNPAHVWKPMLHRFAAATATYANENIAFTAQARRNGFHYWPGELAGIDRGARTVALGKLPLPDGETVLPGRTIPYDTLIVAIGSRADDFGTPGVVEHCRFIDDIGEAERFSALLRSQIVLALARGEDLRIAIVGGGATGVELAAELRSHMDILASYLTNGAKVRLRLTLVESGPRLLAAFPQEISHSAEARLRGLGIEVRTATKVTGADAQGLTLEGGARIDAALSVWAAGVKAPGVTARLDGLPVDKRGRLRVRPTLQTESDDDVFAIGDCASLPGDDGKPLPTTAQVARQQAVWLARALARRSERGAPLGRFRFVDRGSIVDLSDYAAFGTLGGYGFFHGGFIKGRVAQAAHASLYRMHQLDLNGVVRGTVGWLADDLMRATRPRVSLS